LFSLPIVIGILLLSIGLYQLIGIPIRFPPWAAVKALRKTGEKGKKATYRDVLIYPIARKVAPHIRLSPFRRESLERELKAAGQQEILPEYHMAIAYVSAGIEFLLSFCMLPIYPLSTAILAAYAVQHFFKLRKVPYSDKRRLAIEAEMPRFTSYVVQSLRQKQNLSVMLQNYCDHATETLKEELDILITDFKTKNPEAALVDFESRIDSVVVSDLVRGLIGVSHGEDMLVYLTSVEMRMNQMELASFEKEAARRQDKLGPASWVMMGSLFIIIAAIFGVQMYNQFKGFNF
jgi:Flp pilus assembly protein TadB